MDEEKYCKMVDTLCIFVDQCDPINEKAEGLNYAFRCPVMEAQKGASARRR